MTNNTTIVRSVFTGVLFALYSPGGDVPSAANRPTFRVVSSMHGYSRPTGLTEASPGVFLGVGKLSTPGTRGGLFGHGAGVTTTLAYLSNPL